MINSKFNFNEKIFLRDVIGSYMTEVGQMDNRVVVVNADLAGTCRNKTFGQTFPEREYNLGIAEQNLVSFSAGLAHEGFIPFAFSMAPFISMRACEQCRTDVAYANVNVRLMGTYAGVSGGISGATHWSIEDCAIISSFPNMIVLEPCDPIQAKRMILASLSYPGPLYIRSTIEPVISIYQNSYCYKIGKASVLIDGNDGTFICCGITVKFALEASERIKNKYGKKIRVVDMHTIKPIDEDAILSAVETGNIVVAHDHNIIGGLGDRVASVIIKSGKAVNFINLGIPDCFDIMAHAPFFYHKYGYDSDGLEIAMLKLLNRG